MSIDANTLIKRPSAAGTVTIDAVAALAFMIGTEIWGKEQFIKMMENTDPHATHIPAKMSVGTPSCKATPLKHWQKEDSA